MSLIFITHNSRDRSSLCKLCVLCVSVVSYCCELANHRDTENTEVAQRNQKYDFLCKAVWRVESSKHREVYSSERRYTSFTSPSTKPIPTPWAAFRRGACLPVSRYFSTRDFAPRRPSRQ